jgi:protein-arginine kinase activator protein McsA
MLQASAIKIIIEETTNNGMDFHTTHTQRDIFGNVSYSFESEHGQSKSKAELIIERVQQLRVDEIAAVEKEDYEKAAEIKTKIDILINLYKKI